MKKLLVAAMAFIFTAGVLSAQPFPNKEEMKKNFEEMNTLVENYKKEKNKKKKAAIEEQIQEKVAANYDKHIKFLENRVGEAEKRLEKAKEKLAQANDPKNKEKHVQEVTKKIISGEKPTLFAPPAGDEGCPFKAKKMHEKRHFKHKGEKSGCPCMKAKKEGKECPFAKKAAEEQALSDLAEK